MTSLLSTTDQMERRVTFLSPPKRIISLVPSQTELLASLGLEKEVIGITKFCVHPTSWFKTKTRIGGTKTLNIEQIRSLKPDLIIGNKEENERTQIELLAKEFPVWMSDISNLEEALEMIKAIGTLTNRAIVAQQVMSTIEQQFSTLVPLTPPIPTAYFIWKNPYMVAASDTFIDSLLLKTGFKNIFSAQKRYPVVSLQELTAAQPQLILLSSEPYPFKEKHLTEFRKVCPNAVLRLVDGELFSWYGSRLIHSATYLLHLQQLVTSKLLE